MEVQDNGSIEKKADKPQGYTEKAIGNRVGMQCIKYLRYKVLIKRSGCKGHVENDNPVISKAHSIQVPAYGGVLIACALLVHHDSLWRKWHQRDPMGRRKRQPICGDGH
jgi:hypothetical protein